MEIKKRRKADAPDVGSGEAERRFERYQRKILNEEEEIPFKTIRHLRDLLADSKDDVSFIKYVGGAVTQRLVSSLLSEYEGTVVSKDRAIYDLLLLLERTYRVSLRPMTPLVWGKRSKVNYDNLRKLGQTLHTRLTHDQVLDYLDARQLWFTLLKLDTATYLNEGDNSMQLYDYRFVLRLLASLLEAGAEMSSRKFVECNALSFAFAATSLKSASERVLAYVLLKRFLAHLADLSTETFPEKSLFVYLIRIFKNSLERPNQRIPHVVSHFFARTTKLLLHAADAVYAPVLSFLVLKPTVDLGNVPELYKLLLSSSTEHHREERNWMLTLLADSLIEPNDYNVLQKRYGMKLCLSLFSSAVGDRESRKLVLIILRAALRHRSVARDLYHRHNLHSWLALTLQCGWLTRWEQVFLCQLFVTLLEQIRTVFSTEGTATSAAVIVQQRACQMLARKVQEVLDKENDDGRAMWSHRLDNVLSTGWVSIKTEVEKGL